MDEIINTLLHETADKDSDTYAVPESTPYLKARMDELDEEYRRMQKKLLKDVQNIRHKEGRELETTNC